MVWVVLIGTAHLYTTHTSCSPPHRAPLPHSRTDSNSGDFPFRVWCSVHFLRFKRVMPTPLRRARYARAPHHRVDMDLTSQNETPTCRAAAAHLAIRREASFSRSRHGLAQDEHARVRLPSPRRRRACPRALPSADAGGYIQCSTSVPFVGAGIAGARRRGDCSLGHSYAQVTVRTGLTPHATRTRFAPRRACRQAPSLDKQPCYLPPPQNCSPSIADKLHGGSGLVRSMERLRTPVK